MPSITTPGELTVADLTNEANVETTCAMYEGLTGGDMSPQTQDAQALCDSTSVTELDKIIYNNLVASVSLADPQGEDALAAFPPGEKAYVAVRRGVPSDEAPAAGQKYTLWYGTVIWDPWGPPAAADAKISGLLTVLVDHRWDVTVSAT
jgi:hypothetical protein